MPMIDLNLPADALTPEREQQLVDELTTILVKAEGADATNPIVRQIAWVVVHHTPIYAGGKPPAKPHYRVITSVPEGQVNTLDRRRALVAEVTAAVVKAEGSGDPDAHHRVWVFPLEIPEGRWGAGGDIMGLADIINSVIGDEEKAREAAGRRIARSRAERGIGIG
ncbi:Tautomerase enzyme [Tsukamurella pulmonis]|uniref:Tautomerase enzyme n=1 Tax=Tsukamurella pulmonis TaxID=47312 RepID=A0A1H1FNC3_9ACTN|nr:tautomerase family protein [Tsukamurella pulmonis]SDR02268.1 Tautomerase enzyme [Tsukamurella pulmonis]SUP18731.1 4-oxalocrotonate tautomerase family enzyme [Tsukamurella pulmonis]